jgi:Double zinc ribbon
MTQFGSNPDGPAPYSPSFAGPACPNCGATGPANAAFCDQCGQQLDGDAQAPPLADVICPGCGQANRASAIFCGNCGRNIPGIAYGQFPSGIGAASSSSGRGPDQDTSPEARRRFLDQPAPGRHDYAGDFITRITRAEEAVALAEEDFYRAEEAVGDTAAEAPLGTVPTFDAISRSTIPGVVVGRAFSPAERHAWVEYQDALTWRDRAAAALDQARAVLAHEAANWERMNEPLPTRIDGTVGYEDGNGLADRPR